MFHFFLLIFIFITAHAAMLTLPEGIPVISAIHPGQKTRDMVEVGHQLSPFIKWSLVIQFFVFLRNVTVLNTFTQRKNLLYFADFNILMQSFFLFFFIYRSRERWLWG